MSMPRYLTKSRYKLGLECPTKLFYTGKAIYPNTRMDDPFLAALAECGYRQIVGTFDRYSGVYINAVKFCAT
jgi:hypothetical protein